MALYKKLKSVLQKYITTFKLANIKKKNYIFVILLTFLTVSLDAVGISILLPIGEYVLNYETGKIPDTYSWKIIKSIFFQLGFKPNISLVVGFAILIIVVRQIITFIRVVLIDTIRFKAVQGFREKLFVKFLRQDLFYIKQYSTGVYNNVINLEVDNVGNAIILPLENVSGLILITSYLSLMMFISIPATLVVFTCIFITGILLKNILYFIESTSSKIIQINNKFSQNLVDRLIAAKLIRISNMIKKEEIQNKEILKEQFINNIKLSRIQKFIDSTVEPVLLMIAIPVIIVAIKLNFPLPKLGIFIILLARFIPVFKVTVTSIQGHATLFASVKNMLHLIDKVNSQKEVRSGKMNAPEAIKKIEFKNISFQYERSGIKVLNNFSCEIVGGTINAIVGPSGSGKTTLVNMIPRLLEPTEGTININNVNINKINVDKIRDVCAYIEQKPSFIRGTIIEHIAYNNIEINLNKVKEAAKLANAHDFIMKLPDNYNNQLGESGTGLSGGQLQRLDITRGIASEKPLMILDEPTSNLDEDNTKEILLTLKKINKHKKTTIIIVTHDNSILKYCDNIIKI